MASIFDFAYEGSQTPESVQRALENDRQYRQAVKAKLPLGVEGSGIPDSVRKAAQAALERGAAPSMAAPAAAVAETTGAGLLGKAAGFLGKGLGPVAAGYEGLQMLNEKYGPAAYDNLKVAMEEGRTRRAMQADPGLADRGQETVNRITGNAMQGVAGLLPQYQEGANQPQGLTEDELNAQNPNDPGLMSPPQQSPVEVPQVADAQPADVPEAAQKARVQQEAQRQQLEVAATKSLSQGSVSRPEAAAKVVDADLARSGKDVTPEAKKALVAQELTNMKTMDNSELGKYLSYALIAGGVLAAVFDKTGKAGDAFGAGFVRGQQGAREDRILNAKMQAAAAKQAQENAIAQAKLTQGDRGLDLKDKEITQTGKYQDRKIDLGAEGNDIKRETAAASNALGYAGISAANARSAASNDLRAQALKQSQSQYEGLLGLKQSDQELRRDQFATDKEYKEAKIRQGNEGLLINAKKAAAEGGPKGVKTDSKVAGEVVDQVLDSQGLNVSKSAKVALAEAYRAEVQNNPAAAADPIGTVKRLANGGGILNAPAAYFGNGTTKIRTPKP